jgi:hypothetical protein
MSTRASENAALDRMVSDLETAQELWDEAIEAYEAARERRHTAAATGDPADIDRAGREVDRAAMDYYYAAASLARHVASWHRAGYRLHPE